MPTTYSRQKPTRKDDDNTRKHCRQAACLLQYAQKRTYAGRGKSEAIYHYQGYKLAFRTHPLFVRQARVSTRRHHRSYQHTAKQDNKDFHHRIGNIYAAYADSKYLWNEFHRILDIAMAIRSTVFDSIDDTLRSRYLVVLQKEKMVLDNNNQSKTYIHITIWL